LILKTFAQKVESSNGSFEAKIGYDKKYLLKKIIDNIWER